MRKILALLLAAPLLALGACGDDDDDAGDLEAFCLDFRTGTDLLADFGVDQLADLQLFFEELAVSAPEAIEQEVARVAEGLESLGEAFAEFQGAQGEDALDAIQEASGVDFDELAAAAEDVEAYAAENCEDVEVVE